MYLCICANIYIYIYIYIHILFCRKCEKRSSRSDRIYGDKQANRGPGPSQGTLMNKCATKNREVRRLATHLCRRRSTRRRKKNRKAEPSEEEVIHDQSAARPRSRLTCLAAVGDAAGDVRELVARKTLLGSSPVVDALSPRSPRSGRCGRSG